MARSALALNCTLTRSSVDYRDLDEPPEQVRQALATVAANATHLASVLAASPYPAAT